MELDRMLKALGEPMRLKYSNRSWRESIAYVLFLKSLVSQNLQFLST